MEISRVTTDALTKCILSILSHKNSFKAQVEFVVSTYLQFISERVTLEHLKTEVTREDLRSQRLDLKLGDQLNLWKAISSKLRIQ